MERAQGVLGALLRRTISGIDCLIPAQMREDGDLRRRMRLFLVSHVAGPCFGLVTFAYIYVLDPLASWRLGVPVAALCGFWAFPFMIRLTGRYTGWALLSTQNLAFIILFVAYFYGGFSSPVLQWLLLVPILGFFYFGSSHVLLLTVVAGLLADLAVFDIAQMAFGGFPTRVAVEAMSAVNVVSVLGMGGYVIMMALYNSRILASQSELEREIGSHRATMQDLHKAKEAAESANRAKSEFLATMSHELRTPLNAVIGFSEIFIKEMFGPLGHARYQEYARDINSSGTHLLEIINDILDIAKAEAGKLVMAEDLVDLRSVIDAACRLVRPNIDKAEVALAVELPRGLPPVRADERMLKQVLVNLLGNSAKFTPAGGRITVSVRASRRRPMIVSVCDTGMGIAQEHLAMVLKPFYQADGSLARRHQGTGLGLAVVNAIMRLHGGWVRVKSKLGRGTTVCIAIPAERVEWQEREADAAIPLPHLTEAVA